MQIDLPVTAHLPRDYIARDDVRMEAYRRLAAVTSADDVDDVRAEWTDRYGPPPPPAVGAPRCRASARRVPAPRHPVGVGAEGPGATRRLGAAKVAGGAAAADVRTQPGPARRGDRARRRDCRRLAPAGASQVARRDRPPESAPRYASSRGMKVPSADDFVAVPSRSRSLVVGAARARPRRLLEQLIDAATITYPTAAASRRSTSPGPTS